jgi:hypothetical protein
VQTRGPEQTARGHPPVRPSARPGGQVVPALPSDPSASATAVRALGIGTLGLIGSVPLVAVQATDRHCAGLDATPAVPGRWAVAYVTVGEARPWIWLLPLAAWVGTAAAYARTVPPTAP